MGGWPAHFDDEGPGTSYVAPGRMGRIIERYDFAGQAWQYGRGSLREFTTYIPNRVMTYKSLRGLSPRDVTDFENIMLSCQAAGLEKPPTSFGDPFRFVYRAPFIALTPACGWRGLRFGPWEWCRVGVWQGETWQYDLNKAYRWSACQGLPDTETTERVDKFVDRPALYQLRLEGGALPYHPRPGVYAVTHEELPLLTGRPLELIWGLAFERMIDLAPVFVDIDRLFPFCRDRVSRMFWGYWNTQRGPERVVWNERGEPRVIPMKNPFYNPIWAAFITSRVKLRMLPYLREAVHVMADSIHVRHELPTGADVGEWRLVRHFRTLWIRGVNYWGVGYETVKRSGHPRGEQRDAALWHSRPWDESAT